MNKRKKELIILVPLIVISLIVVIGLFIPQEQIIEIETETSCQEGWIKYELGSGTLCSKTELSEKQLEDYE